MYKMHVISWPLYKRWQPYHFPMEVDLPLSLSSYKYEFFSKNRKDLNWLIIRENNFNLFDASRMLLTIFDLLRITLTIIDF